MKKLTKEDAKKLLKIINEGDYFSGIDQGFSRPGSEDGDQSFDSTPDASLNQQIQGTKTLPGWKDAAPGEVVQAKGWDSQRGFEFPLTLSPEDSENKLIGTAKGRAFYIGKNLITGEPQVISATIVKQANGTPAAPPIAEGMYDGGTCPDCGAPLDDEGWHASECPARGGSRYGNRRSYSPKPAPMAQDEKMEVIKIANEIVARQMRQRGETGMPVANKGLIDWVIKQRAMGKLGGKAPAAPAAPPVAESMLENEVKAELLETAGNLLMQFKEAWKKKTDKEKEKDNDIAKDQGKQPFMKKSQRRAFLGLDSKGKKIKK